MSVEEIIARKKSLRKKMTSQRAKMNPDEREKLSHTIVQNLLNHEVYKNSSTIMAYASMPEEIQLHELFKDTFEKNKRLAIPFIVGRGTMRPVLLPSMEALEVGDFGILTVKQSLRKFVDIKEIDCLIVPGSAFDVQGQRLGLGGGYYDRFMKAAVNAKKIALAYDFQIVEDLPVEPHDSKVDIVITESKIINAERS